MHTVRGAYDGECSGAMRAYLELVVLEHGGGDGQDLLQHHLVARLSARLVAELTMKIAGNSGA